VTFSTTFPPLSEINETISDRDFTNFLPNIENVISAIRISPCPATSVNFESSGFGDFLFGCRSITSGSDKGHLIGEITFLLIGLFGSGNGDEVF
jgi:hypothetical protein